MSETEISRIVDRIDRMEESRREEMKYHEKSINDILSSLKRQSMWLFGILFLISISFMSWVALDHLKLSHTVEDHKDALSIVTGKMSQSDPGIHIAKWSNFFNGTVRGPINSVER